MEKSFESESPGERSQSHPQIDSVAPQPGSIGSTSEAVGLALPKKKKRRKKRSPRPSLDWERKLGFPDTPVAGVDEVGRGCLAGPVVAAAAVVPDEWAHTPLPRLLRRYPILREVKDSKLVPKARRPIVRDWLIENLAHYAVGEATSEEIDRVNILNATYLSMMRAVDGLAAWGAAARPERSHAILIDGNRAPRELRARYAVTTLISGDRHSLAIAAASILAKVHRDALLVELGKRYPEYAFEVHKGYGTELHLRALELHGLTPEHRRSFSPVRLRYERDFPSETQLGFFELPSEDWSEEIAEAMGDGLGEDCDGNEYDDDDGADDGVDGCDETEEGESSDAFAGARDSDS